MAKVVKSHVKNLSDLLALCSDNICKLKDIDNDLQSAAQHLIRKMLCMCSRSIFFWFLLLQKIAQRTVHS